MIFLGLFVFSNLWFDKMFLIGICNMYHISRGFPIIVFMGFHRVFEEFNSLDPMFCLKLSYYIVVAKLPKHA